MFLCSLKIKNYRSLEHVKLDKLQQFNVLIGRNNAGKSSVFQALYDLNNANKESNRLANSAKRSKKPIEGGGNNIDISPYVLTDHDNKRSLEILLEFELNSQERQHFMKYLVVDGLDETRQRDILNSHFLRKIRFLLKAVPGKPSPIYLREVHALTEDDKWAIIVKEVKDDRSFVSVHVIEGVSRTLLKASFFEKERLLTQTHNATLSDRLQFYGPVDWLLRQANEYLSGAFFFNPFRHSTAILDVQQADKLDQDGANLAQVLHTLKANNEGVFEKIGDFLQEALPDIGRLQTPLINSNQTNIVFRKAQQNYSTPLTSMGGGVEQLLMIATVLLMPQTQKSALFLEEPESHLHAGAQRYLIEQLYKGGQQVFVSTHSSVFVNIRKPHSLYQVSNTNGRTMISLREGESLDSVLEDIGVRNSDVLLSDAVLFVEGPTDQDVFTVFSDKLGMSFNKHNINVIPMGGGSHAGRSAPIRSELLKEISGKAPVPHLFILDRDERRKEEIHKLETNLNNKIHIFHSRELENYLLVPRAILSALKHKYSRDQSILGKLANTTEEHIDQLIHATANSLYSTVLIKRIRNEIGGLREGLLPRNAVSALLPQAESTELGNFVLQEINTQFAQHITDLDIDSIVAAEKADLDKAWTDPKRHLQLAPGEEILASIYRSYGGNYNKSSDTKHIAEEMSVDEICQEIRDIVSKAKGLTSDGL